MIGQVFNRLKVIDDAGLDANKRNKLWDCLCECGGATRTSTTNLRSGHTQSCGCLKSEKISEAQSKHRESAWGGHMTPEYQAWKHMNQRCSNPKVINFHIYGGRGIRVCPEWQHDYPTWLSYIGRRPSPDHSLDRINSDGNYEPGNVRWATAKEQANNRRNSKRRSVAA